MKIKGKYLIKYTLEGKKYIKTVTVILKENEGLLMPRQNLYSGYAFVDDKPYESDFLKHCVNAKYCAEKIALDIISDLRKKYGKKLRIKH